jgi:hypothetical protein
MAELRFTVEGPRWAGVGTEIKNYCFRRNLVCTIEEDKGWLFSNYRVLIEGEPDKLFMAKRDIYEAITKWNAE